MKKPHWTESEKKLIKDNWSHMDDEQLSMLLPGRTPKSVEQERTRMGYLRKAPVRQSDLRRIENDIIRHTASEVGEDIGRSKNSVYMICRRNGITCPPGYLKRVA